MKTFVIRGALAGLCGALASVLTLLLLGERSIRDAIALEDTAAPSSAVSDEMFSRTVQVIGGSLGVALYGLFLGIIFGVVFAAVRHRLGPIAEWKRALRLGGLAFVAIALVPFLKYPPNPPAVGDPDTVNERTIAYLVLVALAIVGTVLAGRVRDWLAGRGWPEHINLPAAVAFWVLVIGLAYLLLPANPDDIPVGAKLIWRFRLASLGGQAAFWSVAAVIFGWVGIKQSGHKVFTAADEESVPTGG